jgi:hypothetical protein
MSCAPAMGGELSIRRRRASAGGQLEQPSEVNSSTRTGRASVLDVPESVVLLSSCGFCPSTAGATFRNKKPPSNSAQTEDCLKLLRPIATILSEKGLGGNSHLTGFYADHDRLRHRPSIQTLPGTPVRLDCERMKNGLIRLRAGCPEHPRTTGKSSVAPAPGVILSVANARCSLRELPALAGNHPVFLRSNDKDADGRIRTRDVQIVLQW